MANCLQILLGVMLLTAGAAQAGCEEFRARIESQLQANGIQSYSLEVVPVLSTPLKSTKAVVEPKKSENSGVVIGTCDQGSKQLIYRRF